MWSRSRHTAQSCSMSWTHSSMAASMPSPSRSSLISFMVSTSRLSNWTTTRFSIVARSMGAMSMRGAAVTSMPPEWIDEVAREAVDAGAQLEPALPVGQAGDAAGSRALAGRTQDLRRGQPHDRVAAVLAASPPARAPSAGRPRSRRPGRRRRRAMCPVDGPVERARPADREVDTGGRGARDRHAGLGIHRDGRSPVPGSPIAPALLLAARRPLADPAHAHRGVAGAALVVAGLLRGPGAHRPTLGIGSRGASAPTPRFAADSGSPTPRVDA